MTGTMLTLMLLVQACSAFHAPALKSAVSVQMAGFGAGGGSKSGGKAKAGKSKTASKAPKAQLSPKRQWDIFTELQKADGTSSIAVFAKLPEDDAQWYFCGEVNAAKPATPEQSAAVHKRLILEHAVRCNPVLTARARELVCGTAPSEEDPAPTILPKQGELPKPQEVGFFGKPDTASGYYVNYGAASEAFTGSSKKLGMGGF